MGGDRPSKRGECEGEITLHWWLRRTFQLVRVQKREEDIQTREGRKGKIMQTISGSLKSRLLRTVRRGPRSRKRGVGNGDRWWVDVKKEFQTSGQMAICSSTNLILTMDCKKAKWDDGEGVGGVVSLSSKCRSGGK